MFDTTTKLIAELQDRFPPNCVPVVTVEMLAKHNACNEVASQCREWQDGSAEISVAQAVAEYDRWDWDWACQYLLSGVAFDRAVELIGNIESEGERADAEAHQWFDSAIAEIAHDTKIHRMVVTTDRENELNAAARAARDELNAATKALQRAIEEADLTLSNVITFSANAYHKDISVARDDHLSGSDPDVAAYQAAVDSATTHRGHRDNGAHADYHSTVARAYLAYSQKIHAIEVARDDLMDKINVECAEKRIRITQAFNTVCLPLDEKLTARIDENYRKADEAKAAVFAVLACHFGIAGDLS